MGGQCQGEAPRRKGRNGERAGVAHQARVLTFDNVISGKFAEQNNSMIILFLAGTALSVFTEIFGSVNVETPVYQVLRTYEFFQLRKYLPQVRASAKYTGEVISGVAFMIIASYIFGQNEENEKIEMTAPVINHAISPEDNLCQMEFVMPSKFKRKEDLPLPKDIRVSFKEIPERVMVVHTCSGSISEEQFKKAGKKLRQESEKAGLRVKEGSEVAMRYNPPWTIPYFRKNQIGWQIML